MKFETPNILSHKNKIFGLMLLIMFVCLAGFFGYQEHQEYQGRKHYPIVKAEFNRIRSLPSAIPASDSQDTVDGNHANVGMLYHTNMSYSVVKEYYDVEMARHGFKLQKESEAYGRKRILYTKGKFTAFIDYVGITNPEYTYYFYVSWDS